MSCTSEESLPVPEEQLIPVLIDIHASEAATSHLANDEKDSIMTIYYNQIMEMHQMDREVFDSCVAILRRNPILAKEIYGKITDEVKKGQLKKK